MWVYKVIRPFIDLQDDRFMYHVGDVYPRDTKSVTKERINELKSDKNKVGVPLIKAERVKKGD